MLFQLKEFFKIGLTSEGRPEGQNAKIDVLGIRDLFDAIIITDELGGIECRKPNDKAFRVMVNRLGVEFNEMCYVADNVNKDFIVAPKKPGM